jgi:hypothetical protein
MDSVPLLMALTNDTYLTPITPGCSRHGVADFVVWNDMHRTGQALDLSHEKSDAFLTRGQIAASAAAVGRRDSDVPTSGLFG